MSILGFLFLAYDKVYIQEIDYTEGLAFAREEWRREGELREGQASSVFSVMGYLLGSGYYVAAALAVTQTKVLTARQRLTVLLACFALLMLNSAITGGRSNVLLIAVSVFGALGARRGLTLHQLFRSSFQRRTIFLLVGLTIFYTLFVFYQRAEASEMSPQEYAMDFLSELGLEADEWYENLLEGDVVGSILAICILAVSYVTHSFASVAAIIEAPPESKTIMFLHVADVLGKIGLLNPPDGDWFLAGRFPSVPGALWHQFGALGLVIGSLLIGGMSAAARFWTALQPRRLLPLGAFVVAYAVLLLTPALFAADFLSFPFLTAAFMLISVVDSIFRHNK
jgi:hypothetical protein